MFTDWKTQSNKGVSSPQIDIQVPGNSYQDYTVNPNKIILKFMWKGKRTRIAKTILKRSIKWEQ